MADLTQYKTCAIAVPDSEKNSSVSNETIIGAIGGTPVSSAAHAVVTKLDQLWESGATVTYSFINGTVNQQNKVDKVVLEWFPYANITFQRATVGTLRISFDPKLGSWSYVGKVNQSIASPAATMNLGWVVDNTTISDDDRGVILHEFGHALGLLHEHQSPARNGTITLDEDAVYAYYAATQGWDKATIKSQIIDVYNSTDVSNYSQLDLTSIMMYFMPSAMNLQHVDVPPNHILSDMDKAYMVINYPRPKPHALAPTWTLDYALKVSGVDNATTQDIKNAKGDVTKIRAVFTAFQVAARIKAAGLAPANGVDSSTPNDTSAPADGVNSGVNGTNTNGNSSPNGISNPNGTSNTNGAASGASTPTDTGLIPADKWCGEIAPVPASSTPDGVQHGVVVERILWLPYDTVTYGFMDSADIATDYRKDRVRKAVNLYMQHTSIKFVEVEINKLNLDQPIARSLCKIRIGFGPIQTLTDAVRWGWSFTGKAAIDSAFNGDGGRIGKKWTTTYLGGQALHDDSELSAADLAMANATVYHELGHCMGLKHEHASPQTQIATTESIPDYLAATLFDPSSVMLYSDLPYKKPVGVISTLNQTPSATDLDLLRLLYPDNGSAGGMFAKALEAFRFEAKDKQVLLDKAAAALGDGKSVNPSLVSEMWALIATNLNTHPRLSGGPLSGIETPSGPLNDAGAPVAPGTAPTYQAPGFLLELVTALKQFFNPGGNQMFTLQFPGRFLDQGSYAWDTSVAGIYSNFVKPVAVNEAEFRLVDQLYDLAPNVGGPNGTNLSIVYEQLLNNLLPKYVENGLAKQQDQIRGWLMKDVPMSQWVSDIMKRQQAREQALADAVAVSMGTKSASTSPTGPVTPTPASALAPGIMFDVSSKPTTNGETLNRIELSELLMNEYLYAKQDWEVERDALISQASQADLGTPESQKALNDLTRKLAHITATRQAQLAAKYSDAVVRGYSHTVREYMGYLDIASPAEALQNAKDSLREAAMSSLDGSMKVYPVQLSPIDWFEGLSTSFTMEDLTQDPEVIRMQIDAKSQQLDTLNSQLVSLQMGTKGDPTDLQNKVAAAQTALDSAQSTLSQAYSSNVIAMANTCLDAVGKVDTATLAGKIGVAQSALAQLPAMMDAVQKAQDKLTSSSRALSQMMAALALAEATDTKQQQQQLTLQIQSLTGELKELQTRWQILTSTTGGVAVPAPVDHTNEPVPDIKLPQETTSGGSRWQTIQFTSSSKSRSDVAQAHSDASSQQWSCNLWIASGSGSSSSSSGASSNSSTATDDTIDLAFRATLVTVDRGGWFQPQFFKESKAFYKVNKDISWVDDPDNKINGLLPGFPVAFLIAKDVVVRVTHSTSSSSDTKKVDSASAASSGGFLCFSYSQSSSSNSSATTSNFQAYSNGYIIKIPGPQILGYMIQKTDADETQLMPTALPADFFIPDDEYNNTVNGTQPSKGGELLSS
ncbi:ZnMc domain-containing protein [Mycena venus]|uniref:ZnMc domain-containing protein n=1 Tax=Mycena venus TaxID=2733690 RepID=A0A8H7CQU7_9AGAR|nr:ZnMc domain-containing protein [Mycena venus]